MNNKARQIALHITGCVLFLSLPFLFSPDRQQGFLSVIQNPGYYSDLFRYILLILFFYLNYYYLIPRVYFSKKYFIYFALIVACFFIIYSLPHLLPIHNEPFHNELFQGKPFADAPFPDKRPLPPGHDDLRPDHYLPVPSIPAHTAFEWFNFRQNIFLFLAVLFFSLVLRISNRWREAEKEKVDRELSYLKAQINPHFLFNTLNSIYALAINGSDETATAIVKLSGMMRYVLSDATHEYVPLEQEIGYLRDYIELQELRFGQSMHLDFITDGDFSGEKIAPLLLITFVENAFKYGVNPEDDTQIHISVNIKDDILTLKVYNRKVKTNVMDMDQHGLGIENTKNRLRLLYPFKHNLEIKETEKEFDVLLILNLQ